MDPHLFVDQHILLQQIFTEDSVLFAKNAYYIDEYLFPDSIKGCKILDVGGADGNVALYARIARGAKPDVLDEYQGHGSAVSKREKLINRIQRLGIKDMQVIESDVRKAQITPASYDYIYMRNCLHHIFGRYSSREEDVIEQMSLFFSWLAPGGVLVIADDGWMLAWRLFPPVYRRFFSGMSSRSKSSFRRWRRCAEISGFKFSGLEWYVPRRFKKWRNLLNDELANIFLTGAYVLRMVKPKIS
jgi:SAM-dependent methyltransferase